MKRKTTITEGFGYFVAIATLFAALGTTALVAGTNFNGILVLISVVLWAEAMLMFEGLIKMKPICMRVVTWINIIKCIFFVLMDIVNNIISRVGSAEIDLLSYIVMCLYFTTFTMCVAHNLDKFYTDLRKSRREAVLVTEIVSEGSSLTNTSAQQSSVKSPASITERLGYLMAFIELLITLEHSGRLAISDFRFPNHFAVLMVFGLILSWTETVIMFVGVIKMEPIYMRVIKWLFFVQCYLNAQTLIIEVVQKSTLDGYTVIYLVFSIFVVCVAHRLDKFYTDRLKNRPEGVLVTGIVSEGSVSTRPAALVQQELLSMTPTVKQGAADPTAEMAQPKEFSQ